MREVQRPLPPTGGLCPDREAKDNAPLSLLCLLFPVPHPCHFFSTLSHHLFTALPLPCSPWAPYVAISYQGDNSNCGIIFPICYLTPSVISESQNRSRAWGQGLFTHLCCIQSMIRFVTMCVCSYNSIMSQYPMGAKWYVYKQCKSSSCGIDLTSSVS